MSYKQRLTYTWFKLKMLANRLTIFIHFAYDKNVKITRVLHTEYL